MIGYRVTKYNPANRDNEGRYFLDEWTEYCDIGKKFNKKRFTYNEYVIVEEKYIKTIVSLMNFLGVKYISFKRGRRVLLEEDSLATKDMKKIYNSIKREFKVYIEDIPDLVKLILRGYIWGVIKNEKMEVHFGNDFYMYIGLPAYNDELMESVIPDGLYGEQCCLPTYEDVNL